MGSGPQRWTAISSSLCFCPLHTTLITSSGSSSIHGSLPLSLSLSHRFLHLLPFHIPRPFFYSSTVINYFFNNFFPGLLLRVSDHLRATGMEGGGIVHSLSVNLLNVLLLFMTLHGSYCSPLDYLKSFGIMDTRTDAFLPEISPSAAPQPLLPLLAPSPLTPFTNNTIPKLSGLCALNFSSVESMMSIASIDCVGVFAPFLANVICCPQLEATLAVLIGQSSKDTNMLALNGMLAKHCLLDFEQILVGQGASDYLQEICSIRPTNLTAASCPVNDVNEFESTVDASNLLASCEKIDLVNECCNQICQNAISEAARKLALKAYDLLSTDKSHALSDHSTRVSDCKVIVHRWLARKLDPSHAKNILRGLSNCNINKVCPLVFPDMGSVTKACGNGLSNRIACCHAMGSYVSHLQKQSFITNLQALNCAASLGIKLQKVNITENIYSNCHISLKDFSLQVGIQESGCLLPSLPSDAMFDKMSGVTFLCDLNDNIPAPWPSTPLVPASSCNKTVKIPALPAVASGQSGHQDNYYMFHKLLATSVVVLMFVL